MPRKWPLKSPYAPPGDPAPTPVNDHIVPLSSQTTGARAWDFHGAMTREETARIALIMQQQGIVGISPLQMKRAIEALGASIETAPPEEHNNDLTPSELEDSYRKSIDLYTRQVDAVYFQQAWGSASVEIRRAGFRPRETLSLEELQQLWRWINQRWQMGPQSQEEAI